MNPSGHRGVYWGLIGLLGFGLAVAFAASMSVGRLASGPIVSLWPGGELAEAIVTQVRLPRTLLGILVGATLGLAGAALQGLLRNPLAEPGLLGASSGAALGAVLVFYFGFAGFGSLWLPAGGVVGSLMALLLLYGLAGRRGGILTLVLAGIAINAFAGAATSLALNFAPSPYAALEIIYWMLGSLANRSLSHIGLALPIMVVGWLAIATAARGLDALTLGEEGAKSLGFDPARTQFAVVVGTALAVGAAVAVSGVVGFVGLVVPHLLRPWVGSRPSRLLLPSFLGGALLTLAADLAVRLMPAGPELKLGVVTALVGAPLFLHLLIKTRRSRLWGA